MYMAPVRSRSLITLAQYFLLSPSIGLASAVPAVITANDPTAPSADADSAAAAAARLNACFFMLCSF